MENSLVLTILHWYVLIYIVNINCYIYGSVECVKAKLPNLSSLDENDVIKSFFLFSCMPIENIEMQTYLG